MSKAIKGARKKGEGTIYYDDTRKMWRGRIRFDGRSKSFSGDTSKDVQAKMMEFRNAKDSGIDVSKQATLNELFEKFINIKSRGIAPKTIRGYNSLYNTHLRKPLGKKNITDFNPANINSFVDGLISSGYSNSQINRNIKLLRTVFKQAQRLQLIASNPAEFVETMKSKKKDKKRSLEVDEIKRFVKAIKKDKYYALWFLALNSGMRIGELSALKWSDLNFETDELTVNKSYDQDLGLSDSTKNGDERVLKLNRSTMVVLQQHHSEQLERQLKMSKYWEPNDLIFSNDVGGYLHLSNLRRRHFNEILKNAKITNFRIHDIRHTFASHSLMNNVPVLEVSHFLGHRQPSVTLDIYSHYIQREDSRISSVMESLISG